MPSQRLPSFNAFSREVAVSACSLREKVNMLANCSDAWVCSLHSLLMSVRNSQVSEGGIAGKQYLIDKPHFPSDLSPFQ